ncbi:ankyrin repeat-containing domain protein [Aspergillus multicolor]|uniref:ankyrin repeat domain-containing protein n=1 Tax=Aspergillus multicolor TaxID=41759 RepID=UPI003CCD8C40
MEFDAANLRAFHDACHFGDLPATKEAIASGRLTVEDLDKGLKLATSMRHVDIVTALFDAGACVTPDTTGSLPGKDLHQDPRIVRLFLDHSMDPNATHSTLIMKPRRSALPTPTPVRHLDGEPNLPMFLDPECAALLLEAGADPNRCGPRGIPSLGRAIVSARSPDTALLELYIAHGAKLEPNLLFYAVRPRVQQSEAMTRFLLNRGLDPNAASDNEWGTPLHCAAANGKVNLVRMLLEAGADPTVIPSSSRKVGRTTPAQAAESRVRHQESREEILRLLESYSRQESK